MGLNHILPGVVVGGNGGVGGLGGAVVTGNLGVDLPVVVITCPLPGCFVVDGNGPTTSN